MYTTKDRSNLHSTLIKYKVQPAPKTTTPIIIYIPL